MSTDSLPNDNPAGTSGSSHSHDSAMSRASRFLRSHPKLCLFLLTPGIVEYLSGSSPLYFLVLSPFTFAYQIGVNAGLYLPGALLIREASIRWKKGWGSVLLMGAAYGILEEGIALETIFNPKAAIYIAGGLQSYGHWLGVSWVWAAEVVPVHMVFSIAIPILLLGLALPETRGTSLLGSRRSLVTAMAVLCLDVLFGLFVQAHVGHVWMGLPLFALSVSAIVVLVIAARLAPLGLIRARSEGPRICPLLAGVLGALSFSSVVLEVYGGNMLNLPAAASAVSIVVTLSVFLFYALRLLGQKKNERQLIAFSFGLILPFMVVGAAEQIRFPLVLGADAVAFLFFRKLWLKYGAGSILEVGIPEEKPALTPSPSGNLA